MTSRRAIRIAAIPFLGFLTALGLAWGSSLTESTHVVTALPSSVAELIRGPRYIPSAFASGPRRFASDTYWIGRSTPLPAGWTGELLLPRPWPLDARAVVVRHSGWPLRAFCSGRFLFHEDRYSDWGMIRLGGPSSNGMAFDRSLPISPVWPGLAINIAAFTLAWWLLLGGFSIITGSARRRRRKARGQCPKCGYDIFGNYPAGCPECGWNRTGTENGPSR